MEVTMSTQPGHDAWRDTGITEPDRLDREAREPDPQDQDADDAANLLEEALRSGRPVVGAESAEDYQPSTPRPDLDGRAAEADVVEQSVVVPGLDEDDYVTAEPAPAEGPDEV
jgi:hypothetical protein